MARVPRSSRRGLPARGLAVLASLGLVAAAFLPWTSTGRLALDLSLRDLRPGTDLPTVAVALIALAALGGIAALLGDAGWPRGLTALGTGALVVVWLAAGPEGAVTSGVGVALGSVAVHLLAAALARSRPPRSSSPFA